MLISISDLKKQSKFAENSLRSLKIRFSLYESEFLFSSYQKDNLISSAHFSHLIGKVEWAGSRRPTPKSMGQNDHLISIGTIPQKVVGIVPNIVPHIVPNKVPIAFSHPHKLVNFLSLFCTIPQ